MCLEERSQPVPTGPLSSPLLSFLDSDWDPTQSVFSNAQSDLLGSLCSVDVMGLQKQGKVAELVVS